MNSVAPAAVAAVNREVFIGFLIDEAGMNITVNAAKNLKGVVIRFEYPENPDDEAWKLVSLRAQIDRVEECFGNVMVFGRRPGKKELREFRAEFMNDVKVVGHCDTTPKPRRQKKTHGNVLTERRVKLFRSPTAKPTAKTVEARSFRVEQIALMEAVAPAFTLALYSPVILDRPAAIIDADLIPASLAGMVDMMKEYNAIAVTEPELFDVLGLFRTTDPQLRSNILDGEPDVEL